MFHKNFGYKGLNYIFEMVEYCVCKKIQDHSQACWGILLQTGRMATSLKTIMPLRPRKDFDDKIKLLHLIKSTFSIEDEGDLPVNEIFDKDLHWV